MCAFIFEIASVVIEWIYFNTAVFVFSLFLLMLLCVFFFFFNIIVVVVCCLFYSYPLQCTTIMINLNINRWSDRQLHDELRKYVRAERRQLCTPAHSIRIHRFSFAHTTTIPIGIFFFLLLLRSLFSVFVLLLMAGNWTFYCDWMENNYVRWLSMRETIIIEQIPGDQMTRLRQDAWICEMGELTTQRQQTHSRRT